MVETDADVLGGGATHLMTRTLELADVRAVNGVPARAAAFNIVSKQSSLAFDPAGAGCYRTASPASAIDATSKIFSARALRHTSDCLCNARKNAGIWVLRELCACRTATHA